MNDFDLRTALGQRLLSDTTLPPVVWGNKSADPVLPYLISDFVPTNNQNRTLAADPSDEQFFGFWMVSVVSQKDQFDSPSLVIAQKVKSLFPFGLRLTVSSGLITIRKPTEIVQGYEDGSNWRTPVKIYYEAT